jgi:hypothetical protein
MAAAMRVKSPFSQRALLGFAGVFISWLLTGVATAVIVGSLHDRKKDAA